MNKVYDCSNPSKAAEFDVESNEMKIIDLPGDGVERIRCAVCGKIRPRAEFCDSNGCMKRVNCENCYNLPSAEFTELEAKYKKALDEDYKKWRNTDEKCARYNEVTRAPTVRDLIEKLSELDPNTRVKFGTSFDISFSRTVEERLGEKFDFIEFDVYN